MRRDAVVGLVGGAILLVALVGVFRFESVPQASTGAWSLVGPAALGSFDGSASANQDYVLNVTVRNASLARVGFLFEGQGGGPFHVAVKAPNGTTKDAQGSGALNLTFDVQPAPGEGEPNATAGQGEWLVTVRYAPAAPPVAVPTPLPGGAPAAASWTLKASGWTYARGP